MARDEQHLDAFLHTRILRPPKHLLATFGSTSLHYLLLSPLPEDPSVCRLREGQVTTQRPRILTPETWKKRFEGFGDDTPGYEELLENVYGSALRGLEYTFKNEVQATSLEHTPPAELAQRARDRLDQEDAPRKALLQGPDRAWPLSVMKLIVEMSLRSFPSNVRELEERGFFDPEGREEQRRRVEAERLFRLAEKDLLAVKALGDYLHRQGLFQEYEDRFFNLLQR